MRQVRRLLFLAAWLGAIAMNPPGSRAQPASDSIDFTRDVNPLLRQKCLSCHGGENTRGGLRLDRGADALRGGDSGEVIVPGDAMASLLIEKVSSSDLSERMPPKGEPLSTEQVGVLRRWIDQGASWPDDLSAETSNRSSHWAFQPIARPPIPEVSDPDWCRNPIDRWILARLEQSELQPSPGADRRTWIRRACLDLIGLPPTPQELEDFLEDRQPDALERRVDAWLASPHLGERWARHWLDVARFAESHGFEMNQSRPNAWPYRDYVIHSFNHDIPYDRFVREQLVGDFLKADAATGFLVGGPWDQVKSPDPVLTAQQRADELHDMVSTTGSVFLGLTIGCARCHSHKFDPITQTEYYGFKAILEGVRHGERSITPEDQPRRERQAQVVRSQLATIETELTRFEPLATNRRVLLIDDKRLDQPNGPRAIAVVPPSGIEPHAKGSARGEFDDPGGTDRVANLGRSYTWWADPSVDQDLMTYQPGASGRFRIWASWGCGWTTHASDAHYLLDMDGKLDTKEDQKLLATIDQRVFCDGATTPTNRPLWSGLKAIGVADLTSASVIVLRSHESKRPVTADLLLFEELSDATPVDEPARFPHLRAAVHTGANLEVFTPIVARHVRIVIQKCSTGEPCIDEFEVYTADDPPRNVVLASAGAEVTTSGDFPNNAFHKREHINDGQYGNARSWISNRAGTGWVEFSMAKPERIGRIIWSRDRTQPPQFTDRLPVEYLIEVSTDGRAWRTVASGSDRLPWDFPVRPVRPSPSTADSQGAARLKELLTERATLLQKIKDLLASPRIYAGEMTVPEQTLRLHRGDVTQPRERIPPGVLGAVRPATRIPLEAANAERRSALADWITDRRNPLTARVIVNRIWQHYFGVGLVDTPSDFGKNGSPPSHPELLDWLASELIERDWSLKAIHRLILTSSTYRQGSGVYQKGLAQDAQNRLLWRYSPRRLEAESIRDVILAVSGQLDTRMGGPGFDLFEPNSNYVKVYKPRITFGPETFRRMVYQAKPRMQLDDTFGVFDCPDAGQIAPRRNSSITPLQALSMLNSPFLLGQCDLFAERLRREAGSASQQQVELAFALALGRAPSAEELSAAKSLIETNGLTALARALFNTHEFLHTR